MVGAMLAMRTSPDEILERFAEFPRQPLYRSLRRAFVSFRSREVRQRTRERYFRETSMAFLSDTALSAIPQELYAALIEALVGPDCEFSELALPLAVAATDLSGGRPVVLTHGRVHAALMSSCSVPGLFPPQRDGSRWLVDGAAVCEVPVAAARDLKLAAPTLAVHLERPAKHVASFGTSAEVAIRAAALVHAELVREQLRDAPLLVAVPVQDVPWLEFTGARAIADLGERAAVAMLATIPGRETTGAVHAVPTPLG
jgi:predicted acylesterase/phospholipase RssA